MASLPHPTAGRVCARALVALLAAVALVLVGGPVGEAQEANESTAVHDLALVLVKASGQEHELNVAARPAKGHFVIVLKNQGTATATSINIVNYRPAGTAFSVVSAPVLPKQTAGGAPIEIVAPHSGSDLILVDRLEAGDLVEIPITLEVTDESPGRFVHGVEIASFLGADGEIVTDRDSTPDTNPSNDAIDQTPGIDPGGIDKDNSHNDIDYDFGRGGQSFPTPNDEDDHDTEVVIAPPIASLDMRPSAEATSMPIRAGQTVTFLVDVWATGAPIETLELRHAVDASSWAPINLVDNPVASFGGRELQWSLEDGAVSVTMIGQLTNGDADTIPIVLAVPENFDGNVARLAHSVELGLLNGTAPVEPAAAIADAQILDLALRLTVDTEASTLPPAAGADVTFVLEVLNQGAVPARDIEVYDHIDFGLWERIDESINSGVTTGDQQLRFAWKDEEFGAFAQLDGVLMPGESLLVPVTLRVSTGYVAPLGYLANEAEVSAAIATRSDNRTPAVDPNGEPVLDIDSLADRFNYDDRVDDVIDNTDGDEDDHDVAFVGHRLSIGDQVWIDANADGQFDALEQGVSDLPLELVDESGEVVASLTTNEAGVYVFAGLEPGTYTVRVEASATEIGGAAFGAVTSEVGPFAIGDDGVAEYRNFDLGLVLPQASSEAQEGESRPQVLAFTGPSHTTILFVVGLGLIALGLVFVRFSSTGAQRVR